MFKKIMSLVIIFLSTTFAYAQEESITITTYYPSPYGVYNELRLYPHSPATTPCDSSATGTMYYNSTTNQILVCNGTSWSAVGSVLTGNSASMNLPAGNYTILCWGTYFTCEDFTTWLRLDGGGVKSYAGFGGDSDGCDQNTIMVRLTDIGGGAHTWSFDRGSQWDFMWMAFSQ
jgi:hypothetical protein